MYIKKEITIEAILYNNNEKEVLTKFPNFKLLDEVKQGNMIVKNLDDTYSIMSILEFESLYTEIKPIINNHYLNNEINTDMKSEVTETKKLSKEK